MIRGEKEKERKRESDKQCGKDLDVSNTSMA